jgi:HEAT repeat protein
MGGSAPGAPEAEEALRRRLERTFWITTRSDGALVRVHFPRDLDPADRNLLQMIATEAQRVVPAGAGAAWTALERDGAGTYLAAYRRDPEDRYHKRKLHYLEVDGASGAGANAIAVEIVSDERRFSLDSKGGLAELEARSRVRVGAAGPAGDRLEVEVGLRLADARQGPAPDLAGSLARAQGSVDSSPVQTHRTSPAAARARRDRDLLEGRTAADLLAEGARDPSSPAVLERLAALFRLKPEAIAEAGALRGTEPGAKLFADALGTAGTPVAVGALTRLLLDPAAPERVRIEAASALARVRSPSAEAIGLPLALLDEPRPALRRAAMLGAGSLARAGREDHPVECERVERELSARYAASVEADERLAILAALGNAAGPAAAEVLEGALADGRPEVRAAAARGLRLASGPEVDALLAAALSGDADPRVRLAAIFAAGFREVDPFLEALCAAAAADPAEQVRTGAVALLRRHLALAPSVRRTLARVAERDPSPGLRRLAREATAAR